MDIEEFLYNEAIASVGLDVSAHLWDSKDAIKTYQNSLETVMRRLKTRQGEDWVKLHNTKDMRLFMRLVHQEASMVKKKPAAPKKAPAAVIGKGKKGGAVKAISANKAGSSGSSALSEPSQTWIPMGQSSYDARVDGGGGAASGVPEVGDAADIEVFDMDADVSADEVEPRNSSQAHEQTGARSYAAGDRAIGGSSKFFESLLFDEAQPSGGANHNASNNNSRNNRLSTMHKNISTTTFANEVMADGTPIYMPSSMSSYDLSSYRGGSPDGVGEVGTSTSPTYGASDEFMYGGSLSPPLPLQRGYGDATGAFATASTSPTTGDVPPGETLSAEELRRQRLEEQREREKLELQAMKHVDLDKNRRIMMDAWDEF
jgi:hypothetical protein